MPQKDLYPKVYLYRRVINAKLFIDNNFSENIDLDNIADEAFFSKFHFIRLFATCYKRTPYQYLSFMRIEKAKELLATDLTIAQVCYSVGFESVSSFSGLFKRMVGRTPASYQLVAKQKLIDIAKTPLKYVPSCFAARNGWK